MTRSNKWLVAAATTFVLAVLGAIGGVAIAATSSQAPADAPNILTTAPPPSATTPVPSPSTTTPIVAAANTSPVLTPLQEKIKKDTGAKTVTEYVVQPREGLIYIVHKVCGTSKGWQIVAAANNVVASNDYLILDYQKLQIPCGEPIPPQGPKVATATTSVPKPAPPKPAATTKSATWVLPLGGNWCFHNNGGNGFGAPRGAIGSLGAHKHGGDDLGSSVGAHNGSPIYAIHAGTAHWGYEAGGAGTYVWVDHGDGTSSWYFHMSARTVANGAHVKAGQQIGKVGDSGDAAPQYHSGVPQYHLHFETHVGSKRVDPVAFMRDRGVRLGC